MADFLQNLYHWYQSQKRDLPWRKTSDPYKIWISEIILQQTRVNQGIAYYERFIDLFPTIESLANSSEDKVLKTWQGLGYYSRARNLHFTAKTIVNDYKGVFPEKYEDILSLKGIGPYTAAAIASISFNQSYPAVDGNISRVISRLFGIKDPIDSSQVKKEIAKLADEIITKNDPGMHNQAMMELGALICKPKSPECINCPLSLNCYAFNNKLQAQLPVKKNKTKQKLRYFYYLLIEDGDSIYLQKRGENDIWANLYELPMVETPEKELPENIFKGTIWHKRLSQLKIYEISDEVIHLLSHQKIITRFIYLKAVKTLHLPSSIFSVNKKDISNFAVPRLIERYWIKKGLIN